TFEIITEPADFEAVKEAVDGAESACEMAEISMIPQNTTEVEGKEAEQMIRFMEALDDCDDIQKFYTNADIPDEAFENM
ncbi:MAG: YebC/PmpR family DNA-binding transcriptional regulator, partial [Desulfobacterales bacterium]|nr:YebC/PmpR family DNA-binding transcriptional regulator [Desulfobacterales bacterium]